MKVPIVDLRRKIIKQLIKNLDSDSAEQLADYLLWADMSGITTQGVLKMTGTEPLQDIIPKREPKILRNTKLSQLIDAGAYPAPLIAMRATETAIEKAKEHGIGLVGVRNTYSSNGSQAYYVEKIANSGLVGVMCSRSPAAMVGFGSIDPLFGTNPIGFGFPSEGEALIFDTATSAITWYGLVLAKAKGESIPPGIAIGHDGNPTVDPDEAMRGGILPFDHSYKGAGFGLVVEMLAGPFIGGAFIDNKTFDEEWGTFVMAIDPELFVEIDDFKKNSSELIRKIKESRTKSGESIRLPGEQAAMRYRNSKMVGEIDIEEKVLQEIGYFDD